MGSVRMDESQTAVRAYIAARLDGRTDDAYLREELGLALNTTAVRRAASARHWRPSGYRSPGRQRATSLDETQVQAPVEVPAMRDWLAVEPDLLDLGIGLVSVSSVDGPAQRDAYRALSQLPGVVQALAVGDGAERRVLASF